MHIIHRSIIAKIYQPTLLQILNHLVQYKTLLIAFPHYAIIQIDCLVKIIIHFSFSCPFTKLQKNCCQLRHCLLYPPSLSVCVFTAQFLFYMFSLLPNQFRQGRHFLYEVSYLLWISSVMKFANIIEIIHKEEQLVCFIPSNFNHFKLHQCLTNIYSLLLQFVTSFLLNLASFICIFLDQVKHGKLAFLFMHRAKKKGRMNDILLFLFIYLFLQQRKYAANKHLVSY